MKRITTMLLAINLVSSISANHMAEYDVTGANVLDSLPHFIF